MLEALTDCSNQLELFRRHLSKKTCVRSTIVRVEPGVTINALDFENPDPVLADCRGWIDGEVSAELTNGCAISWMFTLMWNADVWHVYATIGINDSTGCDEVREYDAVEVTTLEECLSNLHRLVEQMLSEPDVLEEALLHT